MTPYVPSWKERIEDAKPYALPAIAALMVVVLTGWVVWHQWRSSEPTKSSAAPNQDTDARMAAQARLSADVDTLEKTRQRALESGAVAEATVLLDRAIAKQRERLLIDPGVDPEQTTRLARLEALRSSSKARAAAAQSEVLEKEAQAAQQAGQGAEAAGKWREALRLQREANASATAADAQNFPREVRLAQTIEQAATEPLHATVEEALALAHAAAAQEHWDDALKAYTEARTAQAAINQSHPTTRYAVFADLDSIDAEIASLQAAGVAAATTAREHNGDAAAAAGRSQEAAASYAAAVESQRQLNANFPRSRFFSASRADALNAKRDTVLAAALTERAAHLDREIAVALARRQTVAARDKITEAAALIDKAASDYPRSRALDRALQLKLGFLALRQGDLEALQREIYDQLVPVPGGSRVQMLRSEIAQDIFGRVMNTNPSRNPGRALPVDSVNWLEAQEFCQRLSWLLGARVRLPTEAEMRAAFSAKSESWSADTSGGHSHETGKAPANAAGFHDLAGNLAEWLQPANSASDLVPVAGGTYLDSTAELAGGLPMTPMDKHERARHIGFRIVVEPAER